MRSIFAKVIVAVALLCCLVLVSCIAIPVMPPQEEKPFEADSLTFLVAGETTKEEIRVRLNKEPHRLTPITFNNDSVWIYQATRDTWTWLVCVGSGYYGACDATDSGRRNYFLSFKFNDTETLEAWEVTSTGGDCTSAGVCSDGGKVMVLANAGTDMATKKTSVADDKCLIFLYATLPGSIADGALTAWVDDALLGWLVNSEGYFRTSVDPGPHTIRTRYLFKQLQQTVSVRCEAGDEVFLHHDVRSQAKGHMQLVVEAADVGRKGLAARRLVLLADQLPENGDEFPITDDGTQETQ